MICVSRVFTKIASTSSPASWQDHVTNFHLTWPTRRPQNNKYLHGRPGPRMWCPHVIGRDGWVWVEQRALRKRKFPPQGGGERPDWRGATRRESSTGGVRAWVIVVVEYFAYLYIYIVVEQVDRPPIVLPQRESKFCKSIWYFREKSVAARRCCCASPAGRLLSGALFSNGSAPGCQMGQQKPMFFDHAIFNFS